VITETGPVVTSRITNPTDGRTHQARSTTTYTPDGEVKRATVTDVPTGKTRWIEYSYDASGREIGTLDNAGRQTSTTFDANGNVATETGPDGATLAYTYTKRNQLQKVTAKDVVDDPIGAPGAKRDVILSTSAYDPGGHRYADTDAKGMTVYHRYRPDGQLENSTAINFKDSDPGTGLPGTGPARTMLVTSVQMDAVGDPVREFSPTDVGYVEGFDGTALPAGWQTTGAWSVSGGELKASQPGMAWRQGAADGQIGLTVSASSPLSVVFRVKDASNYQRLRIESTRIILEQVVGGVAQELLRNGLNPALAQGDRVEVSFAGNRLLVRRNGGLAMDATLPTDTADTGVGVLATAAGQGTDRFRFDAYRRTENNFDPYGRMVGSTVDPGGINDRTEYSLLPDGRPESVRHFNPADPQVAAQSRMGYDPTTGQLAWSEDLVDDPTPGAAGDEVWARTSFSYDQRGLRTSVVAPEGGRVDYEYDEADDPVRVIGEPRLVERYGQPARPDVRPTEMYGYNAFGEPTHVEDAEGKLTTYQIDDRGLAVSTTLPPYTPPGGTAIQRVLATEYDATGRVTATTDETGATTRLTYNTLGLQVAQQDPAIGSSDPGVWRFTYDDLGQMAEQKDPTGAVTRQRWDQLGRVSGVEEIVRQPQLASNVSVSTYGDGGSLVQSRTAAGVVSRAEYDIGGRVLRSLDADGNATTYAYDQLGRPDRVTGPDGRATRNVYDIGGDVIAERTYGPDGTTLLGESRYTWDRDGRMRTAASPEAVAGGYSSSFEYDAAGQLTKTIEPASATESITETVGYDEFGNATRHTDGRGNATWQTYNVMGQLEDNIEPAAGAQTAEVDRRWRNVYDAAGQLVSETAPGAITVTSRFDALGRLIEQTGSGARAATAMRTFGYDKVDRLTQASTPSRGEAFTYDDRGLLLTAQGGSGDSSFEYDADGRLTRQVDGSGQTSFTYDQRGLPKTMTSSLAGNVSFSYDSSGRPTKADYGNGTARNYTYDPWGRVDTDQLKTGASVPYGLDYDYDRDGNITRKVTSGSGVPAAGANTYAYDRAARVTGWTNPAGGTETYEWDPAGNRTRAGATRATFDAQDRLTKADGPTRVTSNTWSADGTLQQQQVQRRLTFVVANPAALSGAEGTIGFVLALGGAVVTLVDDNAAAPAVDATGVVLISPDVDPAALGTKYRDLPIPVVSLDADTWQATGLTTAAAPTNTSSVSANVVDAAHPLGGGQDRAGGLAERGPGALDRAEGQSGERRGCGVDGGRRVHGRVGDRLGDRRGSAGGCVSGSAGGVGDVGGGCHQAHQRWLGGVGGGDHVGRQQPGSVGQHHVRLRRV
jgi:YD repeat-containing protein